MNILKIHVNGFGKLNNYDLALEPGINLIIGPNEAGKTTLHLFIRSMLYGAEKKFRNRQRPVYERMCPWKDPEKFGGFMEVEADGSCWRITRDFNKAPDDLVIEELKDGKARRLSEEEAAAQLKKLLNDLSETAYINTVSAGQLSSATEKDMAAELRRYAANVSTTGSPELNADRAIEYLQKERLSLESALDPDAAKDYAGVISAAGKLEESLSGPEYENRISEILKQNAALGLEAEKTESRIGELEKTIGQHRAELMQYELDGSAAADELKARVTRDFGTYKALESKLSGKGSVAAAVALFVLAAVLAFLAFRYRNEYLSVILLFAAAGGAAVGAYLTLHFSADMKAEAALAESLGREAKRITGRDTVDRETMDAFEEKMDLLKKEASAMEEAADEQAALKEQMTRILAGQNDGKDALSLQEQTRAAVESKLQELNAMQSEAAALRKKVEQNQLLRDRIDAIDIAVETLEGLRDGIRSAVGTYINKEASHMVEGLTGGAYTSVNAGRQYDISLNSHDGMISVKDVSAGTADQVYLAMRLATIRFIVGEDDAIPLVLDDSFALYDDERLRKSMRFIADNYRGQVVIFSCQNREAEALKDEDLPCNVIRMRH